MALCWTVEEMLNVGHSAETISESSLLRDVIDVDNLMLLSHQAQTTGH